MTNNDEGSKLEAMGEPLIELTAPDGTVMRFRFGAVIPLDDIEYAVLLEMEDNPDGEEQVLVTRIEPTDDGGMTFVVEENPQKVEQVFNSYVNLRTQEGLTGLTDAEDNTISRFTCAICLRFSILASVHST